MAAFSGPQIVTDNIVFMMDSYNPKNYNLFQANNLYTNGGFSGGLDISEEGGSNPPNSIIELENPGDSPYVLAQGPSGTTTEYQIDLSNLTPGTTYVLSGWYAESADYVGESRMFHSRAFSSSGANIALGNGIGNQIGDPVVINGISWTYRYALITTPGDANGNFNWYVGYAGTSYTGYRYYTNLRMEVGTFPSPIDFVRASKSTCLNGVTYSNSGYTLDGANDYISTAEIPNTGTSTQSLTWECWVMPQSTSGDILNMTRESTGWNMCPLYMTGQKFYGRVWSNTALAANSTFVTGNVYQLVLVRNNSTNTNSFYVNGKLQASQVGAYSASGADNTIHYGRAGAQATNTYFNGKIFLCSVYNQALTENQVAQSFAATRGRYGI